MKWLKRLGSTLLWAVIGAAAGALWLLALGGWLVALGQAGANSSSGGGGGSWDAESSALGPRTGCSRGSSPPP